MSRLWRICDQTESGGVAQWRVFGDRRPMRLAGCLLNLKRSMALQFPGFFIMELGWRRLGAR